MCFQQKKARQHKEMTFQDMYENQNLFDDDDDDSDWEPLQKVVKWFCTNCTMVNFDDIVHCDVCLWFMLLYVHYSQHFLSFSSTHLVFVLLIKMSTCSWCYYYYLLLQKLWFSKDSLVPFISFSCRYVGNIKNLESWGMAISPLPCYKTQILLSQRWKLKNGMKVGTYDLS